MTRLLALALLAGACGMPEDPESTGRPVVLPEQEAALIVALVNDPRTSLELLDREVGLDRRAAENLIAARAGADGRYPSDDDRPFRNLLELDAVPWVGEVALGRLRDYALTHAPPAAELVEGVLFWSEQVAAVLYGVNGASLEELDIEVGLPAEAAAALRAGAPYATIAAIAGAPHVGAAALAALRDHAVVWGAELAGAIAGMAGTYDGVTFDEPSAQAALAAAQTATPDQLRAAGVTVTAANALVAARPLATLAEVAAVHGVGPATMTALRDYASTLIR
jgi:hypothetical protein